MHDTSLIPEPDSTEKGLQYDVDAYLVRKYITQKDRDELNEDLLHILRMVWDSYNFSDDRINAYIVSAVSGEIVIRFDRILPGAKVPFIRFLIPNPHSGVLEEVDILSGLQTLVYLLEVKETEFSEDFEFTLTREGESITLPRSENIRAFLFSLLTSYTSLSRSAKARAERGANEVESKNRCRVAQIIIGILSKITRSRSRDATS